MFFRKLAVLTLHLFFQHSVKQIQFIYKFHQTLITKKYERKVNFYPHMTPQLNWINNYIIEKISIKNKSLKHTNENKFLKSNLDYP